MIHLLAQAVINSVVPGVVCSLWMLFGLMVRQQTSPGVTCVLLLSMAILLLTPVVGYLVAGARGITAGVVGVLSLVGHFRKRTIYMTRVVFIPTLVSLLTGLFLDYLHLNW